MTAVRNILMLPLLVTALALAACEEIVTGQPVDAIAVSENESGGYGPVTLTLTPDMAPVAINFRAEHGVDATEVGKWNTYRAILTQGGRVVATGQFHINYTGTQDSPQGAPYLVENVMTIHPGEAGEYELAIMPTKPAEVRLSGTQVEVRRNVEESTLPR